MNRRTFVTTLASTAALLRLPQQQTTTPKPAKTSPNPQQDHRPHFKVTVDPNQTPHGKTTRVGMELKAPQWPYSITTNTTTQQTEIDKPDQFNQLCQRLAHKLVDSAEHHINPATANQLRREVNLWPVRSVAPPTRW